MSKFSELMTGTTEDAPAPQATPAPTTPKPAAPLATLLPTLILAAVASTLLLAGQFVPMYESVGYREILKNTLIQQDIGWVLVAGAGVLALVALFARRFVTVAWAGIVVGLVAVVIAGVAGLDESMRTLESALPGERRGSEEIAVAAVGIYLTAVGGIASIAAGAAALWLDAGRRT